MKILCPNSAMRNLKWLPVLGLLALLPTLAFVWEKDRPPTPPVIPPNPGNLPKVLLIGDSISGGYCRLVEKALEGKAVVAKSSDNGESTAVGVKKIDGWLGDAKWDAIHYALLKPRRSEFQSDDNVHFSPVGYALMAGQVADCILKSLVAGMFVDAHVHFQDRKAGDLEKVAEWMESNGVQRVINHPLAQSRVRNEEERKQMLANYAAYEGRIDRFCIIFPDEVNSVEEAVAILTREKRDGAIGFGEHYGENLKLDDEDLPRKRRASVLAGKRGTG
jgi:hypothetical protein